jgi:hypothetical protein
LLSVEEELINNVKNFFKGLFKKNSNSTSNYYETLNESMKSIQGIYSFIKKPLSSFDRDFYNKKITLLDMPLPVFPLLKLTISPFIKLGAHLDISMIKDNTIGLSTELYIRGNIGINVNVGITVPPTKAPFQISVSAGIDGTLASGRVGIKVNLYLIIDKYETDLYRILDAFSFQFYVRFSFKIELKLLSFEYKFSLIEYIHKGDTHQMHKKKLHDLRLLNLKEKLLVQDYIKNIFKEKVLYNNLLI